MKVKMNLLQEKKVEVDVSNELGKEINDFERKERNNNQTETRSM